MPLTPECRPSVEALLKAQSSEYLDASRNGISGGRDRKRKPLRLPSTTWLEIRSMATHLQAAFPSRYVTLTSTLEFIINVGLDALRENQMAGLRTPGSSIPFDVDDEE